MNKETLLNYISDTDGIELIRDESKVFSETDEVKYYVFECNLKVIDTNLKVNVLVSSWFPQKLPVIFLERYDVLGFIPHVEPSGRICYLEKESIYINTEQPKAVFEASIGLAIKTLLDGISGMNSEDFREEFHVFWERNKSISPINVMSFIDIENVPVKVNLLKTSKTAIIFDEDLNVQRQREIFFKNKSPMSKSGILLPLELDSGIIPPRYDEQWNVDQFINWLKPNVSAKNWSVLVDQILKVRPERFEYLILGVPRKTGATILVGIQFRPKKGTSHPILVENTNWGLKLLRVNRLDNESILPRGGANLSLQNKKVLIVGCGSVGSHLAIMLSKTGIGHLGLVDDDVLKLENVQRYAIGLEYAGKKKVHGLETFLKKNYLNVKVFSFDKKIEDLIMANGEIIEKYDVVISASGDPTINLFLNIWLRNKKIPFIVGWNEPFGIGGHSQISLPNISGCYRCLFRDTYNISSFAAKEQSKPFHRKHLGCGEVYTPYSALDSVRTGELMARLTTKYLLGKLTKPEILSWKGDNQDFKVAGFETSTRYERQTQDEMNEKRFEFVNNNCPHCKE